MPSDMSWAYGTVGEPSMWNGPSTVAGVASGSKRLFSWTTSVLRPSTSEARMNSWRLSSLIRPVAASHSTAVSHSSSVSRTSRAKACRCRTSAVISSARRGERAVAQRFSARSVRFSSVTKAMESSLIRPGRNAVRTTVRTADTLHHG